MKNKKTIAADTNTSNKNTSNMPNVSLGQADNPLDAVLTIPNIISFLRLLLIPVFFVLLLSDIPKTYAFVVFAIAASTDWVDGQIARRTNSVSKLGQFMDPLVDRFLLGFGVLGIFIVGSIPLWIALVLIGRDIFLLVCTFYLEKKIKGIDLRVSYLGKIATTLLCFGFASVMIKWPMVSGMGLVDVSFLPGFGNVSVAAGMWIIYLGIIASLSTAGIYIYRGSRILKKHHARTL